MRQPYVVTPVFHVPIALWQQVRSDARWTPENPAPLWWARLDVWYCFCTDADCDSLAGFWGWTHRRAAHLKTTVMLQTWDDGGNCDGDTPLGRTRARRR